MRNADISLAKKQLACDLKILVAVQVVALCAVGLGLFLFGSDVVPNYPDWDEIHSLCGVLALLGMVTFVIATIWSVFKFGVFIAIRRLEKETKDGTIGATSANEDNHADD